VPSNPAVVGGHFADPEDWQHQNHRGECEWRIEVADSLAQLPHSNAAVLNRLKDCLHGLSSTNFKKAIIQNRDPSKPTPSGCHPCRAEKRWYGATDTDLRVVRSNIRLWGVKSEIARHAELSKMPEHASKSATEISEMVLDDQWDLKKRQELYHDVHGYEYVEK